MAAQPAAAVDFGNLKQTSLKLAEKHHVGAGAECAERRAARASCLEIAPSTEAATEIDKKAIPLERDPSPS